MEFVLLLARLLLFAVFVASGLAKLSDYTGSGRALAEFGVSAKYSQLLGIVLSIGELIVGFALLPVSMARASASVAFILMLAFTAAVAHNLAHGRTPRCHCFGKLSNTPIGLSTLLRNAGLAGIAALIIIKGAGLDLLRWIQLLSVEWILGLVLGLALVIGVTAGSWLLLHVLQQQGRIMIRLKTLEQMLASRDRGSQQLEQDSNQPVFGLPPGERAPSFQVADLVGKIWTLEELLSLGKAVVLVFTDPDCRTCLTLLATIKIWHREHASRTTMALASTGALDANRSHAAQYGLDLVLLQSKREIFDKYLVRGTPSAVVIGSDGRLNSQLIEGISAIQEMITHIERYAVVREVVSDSEGKKKTIGGTMIANA